MLIDIPVLSFLIWIPILSGLFILFLFKNNNFFSSMISYVASLICLCLCFFLINKFYFDLWEIQCVEYHQWIPSLGISYSLGIDGFSLPLIILTCFMTFLVIISTKESITKNIPLYYSSFLIMQGLIVGMFASLDSILFYVFFESMLIPMFLIIGVWGGKNRIYATIKFFIYTFFGSVFLLVSIIYLHILSLEQNYSLGLSFDISTFHGLYLNLSEQKWLFFAFLLAFAVKVPMWPVHTWLPDAHVEAPTGGSVILAAITLKVGGYGMIRFLLPIVPDACLYFYKFVIFISLIAIVYIGLVAIMQKDLKKLIAYSSISHMGFVTLGIFLVFGYSHVDDFKSVALEASMIQMISHGFISGALFLSVGVLYDRMHTRKISDYGGVANVMPLFSMFFMIFIMANVGLPGTTGFVGEFLIILYAFKVNFWYSFFSGITLILGASYSLWMYRRVMFGNIINDNVRFLKDLKSNEKLILLFLALVILLFGVWPAPLFNIVHTCSDHLVEQLIQSKKLGVVLYV